MKTYKEILNEAPQYERIITKWEKEADKEWEKTRFDLPQLAIQSAMENAAETHPADQDRKGFYRLTYISISDTSWFDENESCRNWFKKRGYKW